MRKAEFRVRRGIRVTRADVYGVVRRPNRTFRNGVWVRPGKSDDRIQLWILAKVADFLNTKETKYPVFTSTAPLEQPEEQKDVTHTHTLVGQVSLRLINLAKCRPTIQESRVRVARVCGLESATCHQVHRQWQTQLTVSDLCRIVRWSRYRNRYATTLHNR